MLRLAPALRRLVSLSPATVLARPFHRATPPSMVTVVPVPVRDDNYAYLLIDAPTRTAAVVDPYDVPKVLAAAKQHSVDIIACLTTHHHFDHSGGNQALTDAIPNIPVYGGSSQGQAVNRLVNDRDQFTLAQDLHIRCLATPCHTQDSICYHVTSAAAPSEPGAVFTGDTLFIAGCGRFFEGSAAEMHAALSYLASLPDRTAVYNGHEYTKASLAFARSVDPANPAIARLATILDEHPATTGRTTIGDEKQWNPFMRLDTDVIKNATGGATLVDRMDTLRDMKNKFRGRL